MFERGNPFNSIDPDGHLIFFLFFTAIGFITAAHLIMNVDNPEVSSQEYNDYVALSIISAGSSEAVGMLAGFVKTAFDSNPGTNPENKPPIIIDIKLKIKQEDKKNEPLCDRCFRKLIIDEDWNLILQVFDAKGKLIDSKNLGSWSPSDLRNPSGGCGSSGVGQCPDENDDEDQPPPPPDEESN